MARPLVESFAARFLVLGALAVARGLAWGLVAACGADLLPGHPTGTNGLATAVALAHAPWLLKVLVAPLLDRVPSTARGRRRRVLTVVQWGMAATLASLAVATPAGTAFAVLVAVLAVLAVIQDLATHGLAVDVLQPHERGRAHAVMFTGSLASAALSSAHATSPTSSIGLSAVLLACAAIMALVGWWVASRPERGPAGEAPGHFTWRELWSSLAFPTTRSGIAFAVIAAMPPSIAATVIAAQLATGAPGDGARGASVALGGAAFPLALVAGFVVGGVLGDIMAIGLRRMAVVCKALGAIALLVLSSARVWGDPTSVAVVALITTVLVGGFGAVALGLFTTISNPAVGATHFAIYMAALAGSHAGSAALARALSERFGPQATVAVAGVIELAAIGMVFLVPPLRAERRFRPVPPDPGVRADASTA